MSADPRRAFPEFYGCFAISALADIPRWTVSGRIDDSLEDSLKARKAPVDVRHLVATGRVRGAWARDEQCLMTLGELADSLPLASNAAYYLDATYDGLVVIDIEPSCPPHIAANLLSLPDLLYRETSMSGKGFHLIARVPANAHEFPVAGRKKVLREEHGWYEILQEHWVTFTRSPVPEHLPRKEEAAAGGEGFRSVEELYASLARLAKPPASAVRAVGALGTEPPKITGMGRIIRQTLSDAAGRTRTLADFHGDRSRFEFSVLGTLHRAMKKHLIMVGHNRGVRYSPDEEVWLLYLAAQEVLPRRDKHNEQRNGVPYLLDRAASMVSLQDGAHPTTPQRRSFP